MSDVRGALSLRKKKSKRTKISAPRAIQNGAPTDESQFPGGGEDAPPMPPLERVETSQSSLRGRPSVSADRTADLVKRRYSTRFNDAGPAPPMPAMPAIPPQFKTQGLFDARDTSPVKTRSPERVGQSGIRLDLRALRDPHLQPEQYVASILADADEADIMNYQAELRKLKNRTSTDLQHNVYQNRTQFIKISKEADKLKTEMRTLRSLMSEMTGALSHAASAGGEQSNGLTVPERKRANRSSVANLEALWSSHLQALWKRVEGSQKFLPAIPSRHIVHESGRWVELNAATWKPRRRVHLILLNDHLLVASEKKRNDVGPGSSPNTGGGRRQSSYGSIQANTSVLVAERCWPLQDVQMADISRTSTSVSRDEKSTIANAVSVRVGSESWTFAISSNANNSGEKAALLVAYKKAFEELRKVMAAEHGERERALEEFTYVTGIDSRRGSEWSKLSASSSPLIGSVGSDGMMNRSSTLIDVDGRQQNLRWVEQQIDGLDIEVALQRFEEAVARTEKLRRLARGIKGNIVAQDIILAKVDDRANRLATVLARRLRLTNSAMGATKENVGWLVRLGCDEMARTAYFDARTGVVRKRSRQLPFTGSLPPHLTALSYVTLTLILHTLRVFNASFPPTYASAAIKWAKERVEEFNSSLERQLSSVERGTDLWNECISIVREHAKILAEVGVDFNGIVARGLDEGDGSVVNGHGTMPLRPAQDVKTGHIPPVGPRTLRTGA